MKFIHFDLRHIPSELKLEVHIGGARYALNKHSSDTLGAALGVHAALALLPVNSQNQFSHFAELDDHHFTGHTVRHLKVVVPKEEGVHLHKVIAMCMIWPEEYARTYWKKRLEHFSQPIETLRAFYTHTIKRRPRCHSAKLAQLKLRALPKEHNAALNVLVQSQTLVTSLDTAATLVSHHPNLANIAPSTSLIIHNDCILPDPDINPTQYNTMQLLSTAITNAGPDWSPVIPCTDSAGNKLTSGYDLGTTFKDGQQLYTYGLHDSVSTQLGPGCAGANQIASNNTQLMNQTWTPTTGTTAISKNVPASATGAMLAAAAPRVNSSLQANQFKWTVNERTDHHGVSVDKDSITIDDNNQFSINASNSYLRTLYAGYQLLDDANNPIGPKTKLFSISATNTLLGIPMPTDPTSLSFNLGNASAVNLYFGSLGTSDWDGDFSLPGSLLTGLWQYGIPVVFLVAGKAITSSATFNKIVNDRDLTAAALAIAFGLVGGAIPTGIALTNTKKVLFAMGDIALSIALQKGMEALGKWLIEQVAEGEIASAFGPVGWVLRAAATLMDIEEMAVTTGEVLSSPACITVKVGRAIDVTATIHPDPAHGEAGNPSTAVWPAIGQRYLATLQYKDGTNFQLSGLMSATTSNTPIGLIFNDIPAGGLFRVFFGVYSASGWLAGAWQSDWITATPNQGSTLQLGDQNITEILVPLAPDTQYVFKEKIVAQNNDFVWQAGNAPTATLTSLACGNTGTVCDLVGITINNSAFQVGYAWRSSGQNLHPDSSSAPTSNAQLYSVQNLSVLADPGSRLITSDIGLSNKPGIAYSPSTNQPNEIDQTNFILDPRGSVMNLRQVLLTGKPGNFGLGAATLPSWGQFPLNNLDALAIHPSNIALAASWQDNKLMMLPLPASGAADADAPMALMVSGEGIRQGLVRGPKAMAVTPDGRILVLESTNLRVQAFDTKGSPVPSFTPGGAQFSIATSSVAVQLDQGQLAPALADALVNQGMGYLFALDTSFVLQLNSATFSAENDPLIAALAQNNVILSYDPAHMQDPSLSAQIQVVSSGSNWIITDPRGFAWQIVLQNGALNVNQRLNRVAVHVITAGQEWLVVDKTCQSSWKLAPSSADSTQTLVYLALSFFPLKGMRVGAFTFLDMAVEAHGYIYVLSYTNDGSKTSDYLLDVYAPDGTHCFRSPDPSLSLTPQNIVAGKLTVDIWRNVYGLTYESLTAPSGAPQPGVGHWVPTPPLFSLDLSAQADLNQLNIGAISRDFAANQITLSNQAFIVVLDANGAWQVKDNATIYHIYRVGSGLQVYAIPV